MNDNIKILQLSYGNYVSVDDYFKLQSNWNSLKEIIKDLGIDYLLDKMNELESGEIE